MDRECLHCGITFQPCNSKQQTCSVTCGRKAMHARLRKERGVERACKNCGQTWTAMPKDKSVFCSKDCWDKFYNRQTPHSVECKNCGQIFEARHRASRGDTWAEYCNRKCAREAAKKRINTACESCGIVFESAMSRPQRFCGKACEKEFKVAERSPTWKGGRWVSNRGHIEVYVEGAKKNHMEEHRLVASRALGRTLAHDEIVIHIDRNRANNSPENLCLYTKPEWTKIQFGMEVWPVKSNLKDVQDANIR